MRTGYGATHSSSEHLGSLERGLPTAALSKAAGACAPSRYALSVATGAAGQIGLVSRAGATLPHPRGYTKVVAL